MVNVLINKTIHHSTNRTFYFPGYIKQAYYTFAMPDFTL
jgi:hypothetical protein